MHLRLAYHPEGGATLTKLVKDLFGQQDGPELCADCGADSMCLPQTKQAFGGAACSKFDRQPGPTVRLAHVDGAQGDGALQGTNGFQVSAREAPALLVSYYYLEPFVKNQAAYRYRDWVMDSGAFSAKNSGAVIDLQAYIDKCLELLASDPTLTEVFSLDVIPEDFQPATVARAAEQSERNCADMWRQGVPAVPTFHRGEPEEFLYSMAKEYPKIAIGGVALARGDVKFDFCEQVFARVWPKKIHGLGMAGEKLVYGLPFHSVDATNWEMAPCAFGNWQKFGAMSVRGSNQDLRSQVKHYLDLEAKARVKWAPQMAELERLAPSPAKLGSPTVRLVANAHQGREEAKAQALGRPAASSAIRTVGAPALDAGSASGARAGAALSGGRKAKAKAEPVQAAPPKPPGELDDKWKKNWWM